MNNPSAYRHIFFDLDNTLTRSRSSITPAMREALENLRASKRDIIVVSGAAVEQAISQTENFPALYLGQTGNHAYDADEKKELWRESLSPIEKEDIFTHIASIPRPWKVKDESDLIEDRGSQISYSMLGHHEDVPTKEEFDPGGARRRAMLAEHPFVSDTLEVKVGGTTTFDYIRKGKHKGSNVTRLIEEKGWKKNECVYVGDALYPGGNDEAVVGVIDVQPVNNPDGTLAFIQEILR